MCSVSDKDAAEIKQLNSHTLMTGGTIISQIPTEDIILNSTHSLLSANSVGGYLYVLTVNTTNPFYGIYPGYKNIVSDVNSVIMKIVYIKHDSEDPILTSFDNNHQNKEVVYASTFVNESKIHTDVFKKSNLLLEPICPRPLHFEIIEQNTLQPHQQHILKQYTEIKAFLKVNPDYKIGIVIMENLDGCKTIGSQFPGYGIDLTKYTLDSDFTQQQQILCVSIIYQLIQLRDLGYIHGDTHLNNAMYMDEKLYNYSNQNGPRVFIIDFGRTTKCNPNTTLQQILTQGDKYDWTTRQEIPKLPKPLWWSYKPLLTFASSPAYSNLYQNILNGRKTNIDTFLRNIFNNTHQQIFKVPNLTTVINIEKDIALKIDGIPFRTCTGVIPIIHHNPIFRCLTTYDPNDLSTHIVNPILPTYDQTVVDQIWACPSLKLTYGFDSDFIKAPPGKYLWVVGMVNAVVHFAFVSIACPYETGTKHCTLIQKMNIDSLYAAGELVKHDNNNQIDMNMVSNTYMYAPHQRNDGSLTDAHLQILYEKIPMVVFALVNHDGFIFYMKINMTTSILTRTPTINDPSVRDVTIYQNINNCLSSPIFGIVSTTTDNLNNIRQQCLEYNNRADVKKGGRIYGNTKKMTKIQYNTKHKTNTHKMKLNIRKMKLNNRKSSKFSKSKLRTSKSRTSKPKLRTSKSKPRTSKRTRKRWNPF